MQDTEQSIPPTAKPPSPPPVPPAHTPPIPSRLHLDREKHLDITWADGTRSVYTLTYLRSHCPCAGCKKDREEQSTRKTRVNLLSVDYGGATIKALKADLVGNYALRIEWSDNHSTGIYSFEYLNTIRAGAGG